MPKVSIVLPTYNGERFIRESLDSVMAQTFTDWELIIVDDCSADTTPEITEEYAQKDKRIRVIHNKVNQKLPGALNIGFAASAGEYLTWTSDDNRYEVEAIEEMYNYLEQHKDKFMVCASSRAIDEKGEDISERMGFRIDRYSDERIYSENCVGACFMYRRSVLETVGSYDCDLFLVEDYDYWLRIIERYGSIGYIYKMLYVYRFSDKSLTAMMSDRILAQLLRLMKKHGAAICKGIYYNTCILNEFYYKFVKAGYSYQDIPEEMKECMPEYRFDQYPMADKDIIIFGAGEYGEKVYKLLEGRVAFFADNYPTCKQKNGIPVLSFKELMNVYDSQKHCVIISIRLIEAIHEVAKQLVLNNITCFCSYYRFVFEYENK